MQINEDVVEKELEMLKSKIGMLRPEEEEFITSQIRKRDSYDLYSDTEIIFGV